ncbi:IS66 family transposase [Burkholderia sp. SIMBA_062]|uniref:IS66 family transposase n=1 Tax=Burkholderia sp. SIMBA_062 TaxID=3085803 RepID=UPI00397CEE0D
MDDPNVPINNNCCENQIRPISIGRNAWPLTSSLRPGHRAATAMSSVQLAKMMSSTLHHSSDVR